MSEIAREVTFLWNREACIGVGLVGCGGGGVDLSERLGNHFECWI